MTQLWACDGHEKHHDTSKWGYFAMPVILRDDGKVNIYCRKTVEMLEELIAKTDASVSPEEAVPAQQEAVKPEMEPDPTGVQQADGLPVYSGTLKEPAEPMRPVPFDSLGASVVGGSPDPVESGREERG